MSDTNTNNLPGPRKLFPHLFPNKTGRQGQPTQSAQQHPANISNVSAGYRTVSHATDPSKRDHGTHSSRGANSRPPPLILPLVPLASPNAPIAQPVTMRLSDRSDSEPSSGTSVPDNDKKRYACPECSKRFERPSSLDTHMNSHTGARPYGCVYPGCPKYFSTKSNMQRHLRTNHPGFEGQI